MRKQAFCICLNKDADQLCCNRAAGQRLCFHYIIRISSLCSNSVDVQHCLCRTSSETPKTGFLVTWLKNKGADQYLRSCSSTWAQFEGDLDEMLTQGADILPYIGLREKWESSPPLPPPPSHKKKKSFQLVSTP